MSSDDVTTRTRTAAVIQTMDATLFAVPNGLTQFYLPHTRFYTRKDRTTPGEPGNLHPQYLKAGTDGLLLSAYFTDPKGW